MKNFLFCICFIALFSTTLVGQTGNALLEGTVSFVTSSNIYVKFNSTEEINTGDTLFIKKENQHIPYVLVNTKSSTSVVCTPLVKGSELKVGDKIYFLKKIKSPPIKDPEEEISAEPAEEEAPASVIQEEEKQEKKPVYKQKIRSRLSASSYNNMSGERERHRMRYSFSLRGTNLKNSGFSVDNYIVFRHTLGEWEEVQSNLALALKVYSLAVRYDMDKKSSVTIGRKINPRISSMGAIDGIQVEKGLGPFRIGAIAGSRPSFQDYSYDFSLKQMGGYMSIISEGTDKYQQSTLGFMEQRNNGFVDRRFIYFQHSDAILKNLNIFTSFEFDLYQKINNEESNDLRLTNLYTSLRYRFSRKFSISASYDNRKNIIYYESYKNFIDRLIENETRQGLRFGINIRPIKYITWGATSSLRFQGSGSNPSRFFNSYLTHSRLPGVKGRVSLRVNFLETGYVRSQIYGIRLSKNIIKRRLSSTAYYRRVNYFYKDSEKPKNQNIVGLNCNIRLVKKLSLYLYYEGIFSPAESTRTRFNSKIIQRF